VESSPVKLIKSSCTIDGKKEVALVHDEEQVFDIKGNTFKQTLIPKSTFQQSQKDWSASPYIFQVTKEQPKYKEKMRSGQILFHNLNSVTDSHTPNVRSPTKSVFSKSIIDESMSCESKNRCQSTSKIETIFED